MTGPTRKILSALIDEDFIAADYSLTARKFERKVLKGDPTLLNSAPNSVFDVDWYRSTHDVAPNRSALIHYLSEGWVSGLAPSPYFDPAVYRSSAAETDAQEEPLGHFLKHGQHQGRLPLEPLHEPLTTVMNDPALASIANAVRRAMKSRHMFDAEWYAFVNRFDNEVEAELHYWTQGFAENAAPNPFLDPVQYLSDHPDVAARGWNPVLHYMIEGWNQGRSPSRRLSIDWFWGHNPRIEPIAAILGGEAGAPSISARYDRHPPRQLSDLQLDAFFEPRALTGPPGAFNPTTMTIDWLIPDFGPGSGGHTNIFRFAKMLTDIGHHNRIWVTWPSIHRRDDDLAASLLSSYEVEGVPIDFLPADPALCELNGDAVIATAWQTVAPALSMSKYRRRFCLIQDYEPMFSPAGSNYLTATATYEADLDTFCASPWLQRKMTEHGRWSDLFWLAPNWDTYHPATEPPANDMVQVVAYARDHTARRCVELLEAALRVLGQRGVPVRVTAFGLSPEAKARWHGLGIEVNCLGYITPADVAELYRNSDIGVSLSGTNYSAVPPDMMACALPVVELETEATVETFLPEAVLLAKPNGPAIADAIEALATDPALRMKIGKTGHDWVSDFSWEDGARTIEAGLVERINEVGVHRAEDVSEATPIVSAAPLASVIIPTLNAGPEFASVLEAVFDQQTDFPYEVLVVDSSSEDDTVELAESFGARTIVVDRATFQHGRTRNFAVDQSNGVFAALLTQDAQPNDTQWLQHLVAPMLGDPDVAGVFGRHVAHDGASPFMRDELERHFAGFDSHPSTMSRYTDEDRYWRGEPGWRQLLYFYSDNNSCLRKSVWRTIPYPAIPFGEDQAWAQLIIDAGWSKAYARDAVVAHSHDYEPDEARFRASEEALFFRDWFGLMAVPTRKAHDQSLQAALASNEQIAARLEVDALGLALQNEITTAKLEGLYHGSQGLLARRA